MTVSAPGAPLAGAYDAIVCDIDGVVVAGAVAVPYAVGALGALEVPVVFATNNASRTPAQVAEHLAALGVPVTEGDVLTSSLAAARVLADRYPPGSEVLAIGGAGVGASLRAVGLLPVAPGTKGAPVAVLQGYGPHVTASDLGEAACAIRGGARWVATNTDLTLPTDRGPLPGNGSLVAAVRNCVDVDPEVIGKPHPPMYQLAARRLGVATDRVLAIGDRLETDIEGAVATGMDGALVLTGVHGIGDAAAAPVQRRPTHVLEDLRGLAAPYPPAEQHDGWAVRDRSRARVVDGRLEVEGGGIDADRASLDALWSAVDAGLITPADASRLVFSR